MAGNAVPTPHTSDGMSDAPPQTEGHPRGQGTDKKQPKIKEKRKKSGFRWNFPQTLWQTLSPGRVVQYLGRCNLVFLFHFEAARLSRGYSSEEARLVLFVCFVLFFLFWSKRGLGFLRTRSCFWLPLKASARRCHKSPPPPTRQCSPRSQIILPLEGARNRMDSHPGPKEPIFLFDPLKEHSFQNPNLSRSLSFFAPSALIGSLCPETRVAGAFSSPGCPCHPA